MTSCRPILGPPIRAIAVLPLENLSRDPEQEYFADGMTDDLITELSKISALRVISRTSVMALKQTRQGPAQIARQLGVDALVTGTVLRSAERVRVSAQVIQISPEKNLWADRYERPLGDVVILQGMLAREIADAIRVKLTPQEEHRSRRAATSTRKRVKPTSKAATTGTREPKKRRGRPSTTFSWPLRRTATMLARTRGLPTPTCRSRSSRRSRKRSLQTKGSRRPERR